MENYIGTRITSIFDQRQTTSGFWKTELTLIHEFSEDLVVWDTRQAQFIGYDKDKNKSMITAQIASTNALEKCNFNLFNLKGADDDTEENKIIN